MTTHHTTDPMEISPTKARSLFIGAIVVALLGLTVLDDAASVPPLHGKPVLRAAHPDSIECLVANPSLHGVGAIPLALH